MSFPRRRTQAAGGIKGAAFREFLAWYARDVDAGRLVAAGRALRTSGLDRGVLDFERPLLGILASEWYPAPVVHALLDGLIEGLSEPERASLAERGAVAVMDATLRGIYRVLFEWMASPDRYSKLGPRLWNAYYDSGDFEIQMASPTRAVCTIKNWDTHHPFICDINRGAAGAIYRAMKCQDVMVVREACVAKGDGQCRFVTSWRTR